VCCSIAAAEYAAWIILIRPKSKYEQAEKGQTDKTAESTKLNVHENACSKRRDIMKSKEKGKRG
jgi:hypothetical protein